MGSSKNQLFFIFVTPLFLLILFFPWILIIIVTSSLLGYLSLDFIDEQIRTHFSSPGTRLQNGPVINSGQILLDPLLHVQEEPAQLQGQAGSKSDDNGTGRQRKRSSFYVRAESDFKLDSRLDKSIARFTNTVFDFYVNPEWAPYETRRGLKLSFKKLLTSFGENVNSSLMRQSGGGGNQTRLEELLLSKVIPLGLYYLQNPSKKRFHFDELDTKIEKQRFRVRKLSRTILSQNLLEEDRKCKIWEELCVSVLSDGVLWNLFTIARDRVPELIEELLVKYQTSLKSSSIEQNLPKNSVPPFQDPLLVHSVDQIDSPLPPNTSDERKPSLDSISTENTQVPFLLSRFLDPAHDIEQPELVVSRWRPNLDEILGEKDLLYFLIQYLRKVRALEYLQAVLDESPDGNEYCRKVLELEYLPGFCRSRHFLENMGLSHVEEALEAGPGPHEIQLSPSKKALGHSRSSSLGGANPGIPIWKLEQTVVDGFAIYGNHTGTNYSSSVTLPLGGHSDQPDFVFRRRQQSIEVFILKFFNSTTGLYKKIQNPEDVGSERVIKAKRVGTGSKSYSEYEEDPDINSKVVFESDSDLFASITDIVISWSNKYPWLNPIISGWTTLLSPLLKPKFEKELADQLKNLLNVDNFVMIVDLVTEIFLEANNPNYIPKDVPKSNRNTNREAESNNIKETFQRELIKWLFTSEKNWFVKPEAFIHHLKRNRDDILLFLVDLLDIFVSEVTKIRT